MGQIKQLVYLFGMLIAAFFVANSCDFEAQDHGKNLYVQHCESCHGADGKGLGRLIPPILNADYIQQSPERLPCIIRYGIEGELTVNGVDYEGEMAGFSKLSDVDIANLSNYIATNYLGQEKGYALNDVQEALRGCE